MLGFNIYEKSINGIKVISDGISNIQDGNASFNTTTTTNLNSTNINNSNTITTNILSTTGNINQSGSSILNQTGTGTNSMKAINISGNITQSSGTNTLNTITQPAGNAISQGGFGTTGSSVNQMRSINMLQNGFIINQAGTGTNQFKTSNFNGTITQSSTNIISQTGTGTNLFKDTQISTITGVGGITQTSGSSSLRDITCDNITMRANKSITQSGTTSNTLGTTTLTNLTVLNSMTFPATVSVPSATQTGDLTFTGDAKIVQDTTSSTTNVFKDSSFKSMTINGNITQTSGIATFKTLTCENPSYSGDLTATTNDSDAILENVLINKDLDVLGNTNLRSLNLLDSSGNVIISDTEFRLLDGVSSNIQTQINNINTNLSNVVELSGNQTIGGNKTFTGTTNITSLNLLDSSGNTIISDSEFRNLNNTTGNIQTQLNNIVSVNNTQTTDITNLRNDHDTHVDNAVLLTGNQTIGGVKTFSSNIISNGISNTGSISSDQLTITPAIKTYSNTLTNINNSFSSLATSNISIVSFTASNFRRQLNIISPIQFEATVFNGRGGSVFWYNCNLTAFTLQLFKNGSFDRNLSYTGLSLPINFEAGYGTITQFTIQYFLGTVQCVINLQEEGTANYEVKANATCSVSVPNTIPISTVSNIGIRVNTTLSTQLPSSFFSWNPIAPSSLYISPSFTATISNGSQNTSNNAELNIGEARINNLTCINGTINNLSVNNSFSIPRSFIYQFSPVILVVGTAFSSNTATQVNQSHQLEYICCSKIRLETLNNDKAIIIYPGYRAVLYQETSYGGAPCSVANESQQIASIRINQLNTFQSARFTVNNTWTSVASINSGSYGQNNSESIRIFYNDPSGEVEITSSIFS